MFFLNAHIINLDNFSSSLLDFLPGTLACFCVFLCSNFLKKGNSIVPYPKSQMKSSFHEWCVHVFWSYGIKIAFSLLFLDKRNVTRKNIHAFYLYRKSYPSLEISLWRNVWIEDLANSSNLRNLSLRKYYMYTTIEAANIYEMHSKYLSLNGTNIKYI